jgi:hypothetical protein
MKGRRLPFALPLGQFALDELLELFELHIELDEVGAIVEMAAQAGEQSL